MPRKLLLADDSVTIQRVVSLSFAGEDIQVVVARDGDEAIARIPAEKPDIVLADVEMPKRSGYEVSAFVKRHPDLAHVPVLLLAGAFEPVNETRAREAGCDGVLVKPLDPQDVVARVRALLDRPRGKPTVVPRPAEEPSIARDAQPPVDPMLITDLADPMIESALDVSIGSLDLGGGVNPGSDEASTGPTLDDLLAVMPLVAEPAGPSAAAFSAAAVPLSGPAIDLPLEGLSGQRRGGVADAFGTRLVAERVQSPAAPVRPVPGASAPVVTSAMVDEVARRVLDRLVAAPPDQLGILVRQVVSDVAERLVREEIDRIRSRRP